jgi:nanoRNase/pAp phosphatase (c-di-AMP/oligoRNAs hydrolase)
MKLKSLKTFPFLPKNKLKRVVIVCHRQADVDAFCSAYGIANLIKKIKKNVYYEIASAEGFSNLAKRVIGKFRARIKEFPNIEKADLIVVVDTGHSSLLKDFENRIKEAKGLKIFIDHHPLNESIKSIAQKVIVDEDATSASEVVARIFFTKRVKMCKNVAQALLIGIMADSQHFALVKCNNFEVIAKLCKCGANIEKARQILALQRDRSEVIARLKGANRAKLYELDGFILAVTKVGSFQASVARALIELGADITTAVGESSGEIKGSIRANQRFYSTTKIHLGNQVAKLVGEKLGGVGGGHATACSFSAKGKSEEVAIKLLINSIEEVFKKNVKEIK